MRPETTPSIAPGIMLGLVIGMDGVHSAVAIAALVFTGYIAAGVGSVLAQCS